MTKLKYHNEIRTRDPFHAGNWIYNPVKAQDLFGPHNARQLSVMKQENIRTALNDTRATLDDIQRALSSHCGFCFQFYHYKCVTCPASSAFSPCYELTEFKLMLKLKPDSKQTRKQFADLHEKWCKRIGLWKDMKIR